MHHAAATARAPARGQSQPWAFALLAALALACAGRQGPEPAQPLDGLRAAAQIIREPSGIAHIMAAGEHDLAFLQGYVHAEDRLFQMDLARRLASGTLAELLGPAALASDVQHRILGLRRAAEASLAALSPRGRALLHAYAAGVNAYVAAHPLPPEYAALELTRVAPWTPADSLTTGKLFALQVSFRLDIEPTLALCAYQAAGAGAGFDGTALYVEDLFRVAPFAPAATIPDARQPGPAARPATPEARPRAALPACAGVGLTPEALALARGYLERIAGLPGTPLAGGAEPATSSNEWAVSPAASRGRGPLLANDPHLDLSAPPFFYPIHLQGGALDVIGSSLPGVPLVIAGHNRHIAWGITVHPMDQADTYLERVVADDRAASGLAVIHRGARVPIRAIPQRYRQNNLDGTPDHVTEVPPGLDVPPVTFEVPHHGPILALDQDSGLALSVQWTGFAATRELDAILGVDLARDLDAFRRALRHYDTGSLSWAYADVHGRIAYFTSAEMPLREDLQAGAVRGLPPMFIRDGTGGNDWLPRRRPVPGQALPFEILPPDEMPHIVDPPAGFLVHANNDPLGITLDNDPLNQRRPGGGIYYLGAHYAPGLRAERITERITERIRERGLSLGDMVDLQADTVLLDARFFVPHLVQAMARARTSREPRLAALAGDPALVEAVGRIARWDHTTPTGIPEGYDASDRDGVRIEPPPREIEASIAATLYQVWRGQLVRNTIDAAIPGLPRPDSARSLTALRHLLERFPARGGVGASGIDFFAVAGVARAEDRRDLVLLQSLADALALLAGPAFAPAFGGSTDQDDYRWGKLHRLVLSHPLGPPFTIPPAGGQLPPPLPGLDGIPVDGGYGTVDVAPFPVRADRADAFRVSFGPVRRFAATLGPGGIRAVSSLAGGTSGVVHSPFYVNLLPGWLTNDTYPLRARAGEIRRNARSVQRFVPAP